MNIFKLRYNSHNVLISDVQHNFLIFVYVLWYNGKESACHCMRCKRHGFDSWVGKILWRTKGPPAPVFLPGKFHWQRNLVGYSPWSLEESDTIEHTDTHCQIIIIGLVNIHNHTELQIFSSDANFWQLSNMHSAIMNCSHHTLCYIPRICLFYKEKFVLLTLFTFLPTPSPTSGNHLSILCL